jgi:hypothetical protein
MKSISAQYQELKEGKMTNHQFLRNARMMFPNFVTNHNSFDDSVKILKNKGLLNENTMTELSPQTKYNAAMKSVDRLDAASGTSDSKYTKALRQGNKFIQEINPVLKSAIIGFGKSLGFNTNIEKATTGAQYEPIVKITMGKDIKNPDVKVVITKNSDKIEGGYNLPKEADQRRLANLIKQIQQKELDVELKSESLNEGDAVKGTPDKAPSYDYPTQPGKYMKVVQEPEVDEQDGIYPATTVTDIPKEEVSKPIKSKNRPDGLEPIKDKDKKNEMKKIRIVKESKKNLTESNITPEQIQKKYNEMFGKNPQTTFADVAKALGISDQEIAIALFTPAKLRELGPAAQQMAGNPEEEKASRMFMIRRKKDNDEDAEIEAMIAKAEEEESGKYTKFDDFEGGLSESDKEDVAKKAVEKLSKEELDALWKAWEKRGEKTFAGILPAGSEIDMKRNKLKEVIKSLVNETLDEYERGDEDDKAPSVPSAIRIVVDDMINRIESNDLDLQFKSKDVEDVLANLQDIIGHRYSDEQYQDIVDSAMEKLKSKGFKVI